MLAVAASFAGGASSDGLQALAEALVFGFLLLATVRATDDAISPPQAPYPLFATVVLAIAVVLTGSGPAAFELPGCVTVVTHHAG